MKPVGIVVACGEGGEIGDGTGLLWDLPTDMRYFMRLTRGHTVVMGRLTYETLPPRYRPLPDRTNIVITRNTAYDPGGDTIVTHSLPEAMNAARAADRERIFIIGGGEIYRQALEADVADTLYLTRVHARFPEATTFFPAINPDRWHLTAEEVHGTDDRHRHGFLFRIFKRQTVRS